MKIQRNVKCSDMVVVWETRTTSSLNMIVN